VAEYVVGCSAAVVFGDMERDDLGNGLGVRMYSIERLAAVGLGRSAPAGADRIDHDEIGEGEPGRGVVPQAGGGRVVTWKLEDARADQAQVQIGGCRARSAVEGEGRDGWQARHSWRRRQ